MNKLLWPLLTFLSGAFLPVQAALNSRLGKAINSPLHAALISFFVGLVALVAYIVVTGQRANLTDLRSIPVPVWLGGLLGAFYITVIIFAFPKIGPAYTFGLIVAGQLIVSVALDHFNILVAAPHPINVYRVLGVCLIIAGVVLVRKF